MIEKVNPMHPDKLADRIAGAIVDLAYKHIEKCAWHKEKRYKIRDIRNQASVKEVIDVHENAHNVIVVYKNGNKEIKKIMGLFNRFTTWEEYDEAQLKVNEEYHKV